VTLKVGCVMFVLRRTVEMQIHIAVIPVSNTSDRGGCQNSEVCALIHEPASLRGFNLAPDGIPMRIDLVDYSTIEDSESFVEREHRLRLEARRDTIRLLIT
jgi:hypothetical protein